MLQGHKAGRWGGTAAGLIRVCGESLFAKEAATKLRPAVQEGTRHRDLFHCTKPSGVPRDASHLHRNGKCNASFILGKSGEEEEEKRAAAELTHILCHCLGPMKMF